MSNQVQAKVSHEIGADGSVIVRTDESNVTVRGVAGSLVAVRGLGSRPLEDDFRIEKLAGRLEVGPRDDGPLRVLGLAWLVADSAQGLDIEVPLGASVRIETASGSITVSGTTGSQRYKSASGEIELHEVGGELDVDGVSGDVRISGTADITLDARTVSGDVDVDVPSFRAARAKTMSGDVRLRGRFAEVGPHDLQTVSGDIILSPGESFRVEMSTISGDLSAMPAASVDGRAGRRIATAGTGSPLVAVRTVSGDVRVEPSSASPRPAAEPVRADARLAILRDLENGTIDVDEAGRRLSELDEEPQEPAANDWGVERGPHGQAPGGSASAVGRFDDGQRAPGSVGSAMRAADDEALRWSYRA